MSYVFGVNTEPSDSEVLLCPEILVKIFLRQLDDLSEGMELISPLKSPENCSSSSLALVWKDFALSGAKSSLRSSMIHPDIYRSGLALLPVLKRRLTRWAP
jgi:hypothetical protein